MQRALVMALAACVLAPACIPVAARADAPAWPRVKQSLVVVGYRKSGCTFTADRGNCAFKSYGTAFCIRSRAGLSEFITNAHVVAPAPDGYTLVVLLSGFQQELPATIEQQNAGADLAIISAATIGVLPVLTFSSRLSSDDTSDVAVGGFGYEEAVLFGGLFGGATIGGGDLTPAWHQGHISALHPQVNPQFIDFDVPGGKSSEGLSGAPLFDPKTGVVYGVQDWYPTNLGGSSAQGQVSEDGDNLAIARNVVIAFIGNQPVSTGLASLGGHVQTTSAVNDNAPTVNDPVTIYRRAADQGDASAQNSLGLMYLDGTNNLTQDYALAKHYFQLAAAQGNAKAQSNLGYLYHFGLGVTQDYPTAAHYYNLAIVHGDATAQNNLGTLYYYGQGVARNLPVAVRLYKLAAAGGNGYAQSNLGYMYEMGEVVPKNYAIARRYFELSAAQGNGRGETNLGYLYHQGLGVTENLALALKYYQAAAAQGDAGGERNLGTLYENGAGVPKDINKALSYYQLAVAQGDARGQYLLGRLYELGTGVTQDYAKAESLYQSSADQGDSDGEAALGYLYDTGHGVAQSDAMALKYYQLAAAQGVATAQNNLGTMYSTGQGVPVDSTKAFYYFTLAAQQNNGTAQYNLGGAYESGKGVTRNYALALKYYKLAAAQGIDGASAAVARVSKLIPNP
jgi:hypothetical protein